MRLDGDAYTRGRAQAACGAELIEATQRAIDMRVNAARAALDRPDIGRYIDQQAAFLIESEPDSAAEIRGIADAFDRPFETLIAYLHLGIIGDMADGCSALAWNGASPAGPLLVKNRDYRGEHAQLQRVFLHRDPGRPGEALLCVGSLGSPGAFSSGMNAAGFALVDTQVRTRDHGIGLLRYVLMTRLLWRCRNVEEALAEIDALPHAGGGTLVMADASGACAAVELGHRGAACERGEPHVARTNHFLLPACAAFGLPPTQDPLERSTQGRLARLRAWLEGQTERPTLADLAALMGDHGRPGEEALCRHGREGDARTISCAVFAPVERRLYFCPAEPCAGRWLAFECRN
jgi:predicted choloylglycine hydrolase